MSKRTRQYIGILAALAAYYLVHEGAHLLYALFTGVLKQINFMGLGVQIDVYAEHMTNMQLGIFCLVGALATFCIGYLLAALARSICRAHSKLLRAVLYYIDYECNTYMEQWDFEHWGTQYWTAQAPERTEET